MKNPDVPVIYEIDEETNEATGTVYWFCSKPCCDTFRVEGTVNRGQLDGNYPTETTCCLCGRDVRLYPTKAE